MSNLDSRARRLAQKAGLIARKSRRLWSLDNNGEYMLVDLATNFSVAGHRYDMSAEEVIAYCIEDQ